MAVADTFHNRGRDRTGTVHRISQRLAHVAPIAAWHVSLRPMWQANYLRA